MLVERYRQAGKKEKGRILGDLIELTGYGRCYGAYLLRRYGQRVRLGRVVLAAQIPGKARRAQRQRGRIYDAAVVEVFMQIWRIMDHPCGKRLVAMLPAVLPILERYQ